MVDTTAPVLVGVPGDTTVECVAPAAASVTATDNCDPAPVVDFAESSVPGSAPVIETITRTWTATDACGNSASASQVIVVQNTNPPEVLDAVVSAAVGSPAGPAWPVASAWPDFAMCIDPLAGDYFLDIDTLTSSAPLAEGVLNAFFLDPTSLPVGWLAYWAAKGVDGVNDSGGWELLMWEIIHGDEPFFYLKLSGADYLLIDGLHYALGGGEPVLRVPGDYPQHSYQYTGTVQDENGCLSGDLDVFFAFHTVPAPTITGADIVCAGSVVTYTTEAGMADYAWAVSGGVISAGGTTSDDSVSVTWGSGASGSVSVNYIDPNACTAAASTIMAVTIDALPVVTDAAVTAAIGSPGIPWPVNGAFPAFEMCIDPLVAEYYYLDIDTLDSTTLLAAGTMNAFYLAQGVGDLPVGWLAYWAARGVDGSNNSGGWELKMWDIINGNEPFFYIKRTTGGDIILVDGLQYAVAGYSGEPTLRVPGDYPQHAYRYAGTVQDENGCTSALFDVYFSFNTVPVPTILGNDIVCSGSIQTYITEGGMANYDWTVSGGTISAGGGPGNDTVLVTWGAGPSGWVSVNYTDGNGCTAANETVWEVTIGDAQPPWIIVCASDQILQSDETCQATLPDLTGEVVATDNCDGLLTISQDPVPGTVLTVGTYPVTFLVEDAAGNGSICEAIIDVADSTNLFLQIIQREVIGTNWIPVEVTNGTIYVTNVPEYVYSDVIQVAWPETCSDYALEGTLDLTQPLDWTVVPISPVVITNYNWVTVPGTNDYQFFRLQK